MSKIRKTWEKFYGTLGQLPEGLKQLAPFVVEALPIFKRYKVERMLDLGCGAGRHCVYLAKNRFDVIGVDVSRSALRLAKEWSKNEKLTNVRFVRATMTCLPFGNCHFDSVISVSVIHHAMKKDIVKTVDEIYRVLKENGVFLANLASVKDYRCGQGHKVEDGTFRILEHFEEECFEELHHFFEEKEILELTIRFSKTAVESFSGGKKDQRHHWWKTISIK